MLSTNVFQRSANGWRLLSRHTSTGADTGSHAESLSRETVSSRSAADPALIDYRAPEVAARRPRCRRSTRCSSSRSPAPLPATERWETPDRRFHRSRLECETSAGAFEHSSQARPASFYFMVLKAVQTVTTRSSLMHAIDSRRLGRGRRALSAAARANPIACRAPTIRATARRSTGFFSRLKQQPSAPTALRHRRFAGRKRTAQMARRTRIVGGRYHSILRAAAAISAPLDLVACGYHLARGFNRVYSTALPARRSYRRRRRQAAERFPGLFDGKRRMRKARPPCLRIRRRRHRAHCTASPAPTTTGDARQANPGCLPSACRRWCSMLRTTRSCHRTRYRPAIGLPPQ